MGDYRIENLDYEEETNREPSEDSERGYMLVYFISFELVHRTLNFKLNI